VAVLTFAFAGKILLAVIDKVFLYIPYKIFGWGWDYYFFEHIQPYYTPLDYIPFY
jgi:hypothetical protein